MNACDVPDVMLFKRDDVALQDVWIEYVGEEDGIRFDSDGIGKKRSTGGGAPNETEGVPNDEDGPGLGLTEEEVAQRCHTWGYQSGPTEYLPRRLDKIMFCVNEADKGMPGSGLRFGPEEGGEIRRLGVGVKVKPEGDSEDASDTGGVWLSDHFGLITRFAISSTDGDHDASGGGDGESLGNGRVMNC